MFTLVEMLIHGNAWMIIWYLLSEAIVCPHNHCHATLNQAQPWSRKKGGYLSFAKICSLVRWNVFEKNSKWSLLHSYLSTFLLNWYIFMSWIWARPTRVSRGGPTNSGPTEGDKYWFWVLSSDFFPNFPLILYLSPPFRGFGPWKPCVEMFMKRKL